MIEIRPAGPADFEAVAALTMDVYVNGGFVHEESAYVEKLQDTEGRAEQAEVVVAVANGEIVGSVTVAEPESPFADVAGPGELEFRMLAVAPTARGKGAGSALVQYALDAAYDRGKQAVVISTEPGMIDARRIYDRNHFVPAPDRNWEPVPGVPLTVLVREVA
ncbi:GNAT family N-acetyltransferase [Rhodococcus tukisamuensis]|uniref:Predicted N-acetyltransferase YhbS n=1 Tax=Rhodococcus tukisamuensis TaxID=168276 RepID=A0A1G6XF96_9NOCA|nr:GNAT family N-acetyltransferase [Rhodococcus tukisamuensis]SDD76840.1 Predicted N-acetyltransferase YhbS [Rhodococcus tukisamuensis]